MSNKGKTVSLVLGSGGARGLAHIGIIRWLEENGYQIRSVAGCSMGALVGGIYAAGKLDEFEQWIRALTPLDILAFLDVTFGKGGFVKGERIINTLKKLTGDRSIEDLPIPYTAVAADIVREKEVWIDKGPLFDAIRASISLPFFFTPFQYYGVNLIDGGVLNPVPIAPTFKDLTDLTIAVNLGGSPDGAFEEMENSEKKEAEESHFQEKIQNFISTLLPMKPEKKQEEWGMLYIANQSFDAMQGTIARQKLAAYPPDFVVEIARNACGTLEFDRAEEMIALGYEKAGQSLSEIEQRRM
ncbi:MAG: serine protease [bacterium]|nr:serine protease [bacterium]